MDDDATKAPAMTAHKARWAALFQSAAMLILYGLGLVPSTEDLIHAEAKALFENIAVLLILIAAPAAGAYIVRNKPK